ncbi:MAG: hypothetical protein IKR92_00775 [Alphaproteobacteria bacterium]|nr:hypothetical protein [Alphaproteobacteria bacterium]
MKCTFFTFGGNFMWEDIYNYKDWVIQRNLVSQKCRLLDPLNIRRHSGSFEQCKETLLKYIEAYELDDLYDDTVIILHGFGRSKKSVKPLADAFKDLKMNVICLGYPSLRRGIAYHATMLSIFIKNLDIKGKLYIVNVGASCLITRRLLTKSNNYRHYNIARILDINPLNSGSDLAEILAKYSFLNFFMGPMLHDISTPKATAMPRLPHDIEHGIVFAPISAHDIAKKMLARFDSFPFSTPPSEETYATTVMTISQSYRDPLKSEEIKEACRNFIRFGRFSNNETLTDESLASMKIKRVQE